MDTQLLLVNQIQHTAIHIVRVALSLIGAHLYRSMVAFQPTSLANFLYEIHHQTTCEATYATWVERVEAG